MRRWLWTGTGITLLVFSLSTASAQPPATPTPSGSSNNSPMPLGETAPSPPMPPLTLPQPTQPGTTPSTPPSPPPATPTEPSLDQLLANASARGTEAESTAFPTIFGDLLGGGGIAGPLPVFTNAAGQVVNTPVFVVLPNGQRLQIAGPTPPGRRPFQPVDDLLRARADQLTPLTQPGSPAVVGQTILFPPPGTRFDESLAALVIRIPTFTRGAFKITENDTPRPTTRAYFTYSFYDQVFKTFGGPLTPRAMLHQQIFGLEYANDERTFSVGIRLPYNQFVSPGFYSSTSLGDLTMIGKVLLIQDEQTGSLLSGGLAITAPTGELPFANTITGQNIRGTLIQPWLGHIFARGDWYIQGFNALVVPTDSNDITFYTSDLAFGYYLRRAPGEFLSALIPVLETHLNVPLNHRGAQNDPVGFVTNFTLLGGVHAFFRDTLSVGFASGAPLTGPRPFSLQSTFTLNWWF